MKETVLFIGIALLVTGAIIFLAFYYSKEYVVRRKLTKSPPKPISRFQNDEVGKIVGKVEYIGNPLKAPLSGRACAYYYVLIEELVSTGKSAHWKKMIEEEVGGNFGIREGDYCAQIKAEFVKSYIVQDKQYKSGMFEDATEALNRYLESHGKKSENYFGWNKKIRYKEGILEANELIAVFGKGTWKRVESNQWSDTYGKVLFMSDLDKSPLYLSDDPRTLK